MSATPHPAAYGAIGGYAENPLLLPGKEPVFAYGALKSGIAYKAGTVLGLVTLGAVTSGVKASGANTGNGTFVLDGTNPKRLGAKLGIYRLRVIDVPTTHGTIWELTDPDGFSLGNPVVAGSGGTKTVDNDIKGVLTDGGTDWIVGDGFDITIAGGTGLLTTAVAAAEDGSDVPVGILPEDVDATSASKNTGYYVEGYFNETALIFGAGHTADTVRTKLREQGIHIRTMRYSG